MTYARQEFIAALESAAAWPHGARAQRGCQWSRWSVGWRRTMEYNMTRAKFETDRRGLIGGTLGTLITLAGVPEAIAAPAVSPPATIRKALPPRGSYGIVLPGIKRTAFLNAPAGMSPAAFRGSLDQHLRNRSANWGSAIDNL